MFRDRDDAARQLADHLKQLHLPHALVLGIPRGGVAIAVALAEHLEAEADVVLARKLRAPQQPELAIGAISEDGEVYLTPYGQQLGADHAYLEQECEDRRAEIKRRREMFRTVRPPASIEGRSVILTDDGIATGSTMLAALHVVQANKPAETIIAVPVMPADRVDAFRDACDRLVYLAAPRAFMAIGQFYENFEQLDDQTTCDLLRQAAAKRIG